MSATMIPSTARMRQSSLARPSASLPSANSIPDRNSFVDLQFNPYPSASVEPFAAPPVENPVPELIPDELFQLLRANDLISEKGVRDHIIRRAFKAMREQQELKSAEALERLQAIYPYLQIDTIRKIIYRIGPGCNRKALM